jgi:hypothetical protein
MRRDRDRLARRLPERLALFARGAQTSRPYAAEVAVSGSLSLPARAIVGVKKRRCIHQGPVWVDAVDKVAD